MTQVVRATLRWFHSPDVLDLPDSYLPPDPNCFGFLLQAMFGPDNGPGEESFDVMVCTPSWFAQELADHDGILMGRHHLFVSHYDINKIKQYILDYAERCTGNTWHEVAEKLGRLGKWEFEDYKPALNH